MDAKAIQLRSARARCVSALPGAREARASGWHGAGRSPSRRAPAGAEIVRGRWAREGLRDRTSQVLSWRAGTRRPSRPDPAPYRPAPSDQPADGRRGLADPAEACTSPSKTRVGGSQSARDWRVCCARWRSATAIRRLELAEADGVIGHLDLPTWRPFCSSPPRRRRPAGRPTLLPDLSALRRP